MPVSMDGGPCHVCMAGAVLSTYLDPRDIVGTPVGRFDEPTLAKLDFLDYCRQGRVRAAMLALVPPPGDKPIPQDRHLPSYAADRDAFMIEMRTLLHDFRTQGY